AQALDRAEGPPAEADVPADRLENEGGQDVEEVVVGDPEPGMDRVHAVQGASAPVALVAVLDQLADDQIRVVVPPLGAGGELAGAVEQGTDARHGVGAEEREFERPDRVEREVVPGREEDNALAV